MLPKTWLGLSLLALVLTSTAFYAGHKEYVYLDKAPLCGLATDAMQPVMNLFFDGKVTHACHWQTLDFQERYRNIGAVYETEKSTRRLGSSALTDVFQTIRQEGRGDSQAAILQPKKYTQQWRLAYCHQPTNSSATSEQSFCQYSKLGHVGQVKVLLDGQGFFWGFTPDLEPIELELVEKIKVRDRRDLLYV